MIYEAGLVTIVRTILILAGVYYGLRILVRFLFPYFIKRFLNKQQEKYANSQNSHSSGSTNTKSEKKSDNKDKLGDYVDYEEVE